MPKGKRLLGSLLIGTAIGAVAGLLLAPKAGKENRKAVRKGYSALKRKKGTHSHSAEEHAGNGSHTHAGS